VGLFEGGLSGFALSFVSETQLRVRRGWNGMTTAYFGNHISPRGAGMGRAEGLQIQKDKNSLVIFISAVCVWGKKREIVFKNSLQGLQC
jgi:hypothetical protein